jgi:hypothetical protein
VNVDGGQAGYGKKFAMINREAKVAGLPVGQTASWWQEVRSQVASRKRQVAGRRNQVAGNSANNLRVNPEHGMCVGELRAKDRG